MSRRETSLIHECVQAGLRLTDLLDVGTRQALTPHQQQAIEPLLECRYRREAEKEVERRLEHLCNAAPEHTTTRAHELARVFLNEQHAITQAMVPALTAASSDCGFTQIERLDLPDRLHIVAEREDGKALMIEAPNKLYQPLQLQIETLGYNDQGCEQALRTFNAALERRGITLARTSAKRTRPPKVAVRQQAAVRR